MQRLKFSKGFAVLTILLTTGMFTSAQTYTESQKIIRSFPAGAETRMDLSNKYGTIQLIPWKKDSVHISIDLTIKSTSASKLEKLKKDINFDFSNTKYYIEANTIFGSNDGNFFSDLKDLSGTIIPSKNEVKIDYTIHVPSYLNISITNKYGDVYIDDMKGSVSVNLSNGDIKANSLTGDASISLNFGNGMINELSNAKLNISYADIEIQSAGKLNIESKSSKIRIAEVEILKILSKRDKYSVSRIDNFGGESWFSEVWLSKINEEIDYTPRYGTFKVDSVPAGFSYINLNTEFTDLSLIFSKTASYQLEILMHDNVMLRMPEEYGELEVVGREEEATHMKGMVGPVNKPGTRVKITAPKKCIINLQTR